ncbi:MAG: SiaB family protein kinase [Bacteroidia bacterium]|jgi:hypothetical protein|nr:SiaB family protein kinase [Bacteroidia bacterium]
MLNEAEVRALLTDPMTDWFYLGQVSDGFIDSFIGLLDARPQFRNLSRAARRRLMQSLVEALQNIRNYTPENLTGFPEAVVLMQRLGETDWMLRCGNVMLSENVDELQKRLHVLSDSDSEQLKSLYMNQMSLTLNDSNRKSAGLGLIEMARSSSAPIKYKFVPLNQQYTFFAVELQISLA